MIGKLSRVAKVSVPFNDVLSVNRIQKYLPGNWVRRELSNTTRAELRHSGRAVSPGTMRGLENIVSSSSRPSVPAKTILVHV